MPSLPILFEDRGGPGPGGRRLGRHVPLARWHLLVILLSQIEDPPVRSMASLSGRGVVLSESNASHRDTEGAISLANSVMAAPLPTVPSQCRLGRSLCPQNKTRKGRDRKKAVPREGPFHGNHAKVRLSSRQEGSRVVVAFESELGSAGSQAGPQHAALPADWLRPLRTTLVLRS